MTTSPSTNSSNAPDSEWLDLRAKLIMSVSSPTGVFGQQVSFLIVTSLLDTPTEELFSLFSEQDLAVLQRAFLICTRPAAPLQTLHQLCQTVTDHILTAQFLDQSIHQIALQSAIDHFLVTLKRSIHEPPPDMQFRVLKMLSVVLMDAGNQIQNNLEVGVRGVDDLEAYEKMMVSVLKGLQLLLSENKALFGTTDVVKRISDRVQALVFPVAAAAGVERPGRMSPQRGGRGRSSSEVSWRSNASRRSAESESEGEGVGVGGGFGERFSAEKVKLNALYCLSNLAKAHPKLLYQKWDLFLSPTHPPTLFSLLHPTTTSTPKIRIAASHLLQTLLESSHAYLSVAQFSTSKKESNFTSLSAKLAEMVVYLHRELVGVVRGEMDVGVLAVEYGTLAVLVANSPYERLLVGAGCDLRGEVVNGVVLDAEGCESDRDLSLEKPRLVLLTHLLDAGLCVPADSTLKSHIQSLLLNSLFPLPSPPPADTPALTALDTYRALIRNQFSSVKGDWWDVIEPRVVEPMFLDLEVKGTTPAGVLVRVAVMKLVEEFASAVAKHVFTDPVVPGQEEERREWTTWWHHILTRYIRPCLGSRVYALRALGLEVLARVPGEVVAVLEEGVREELCRDGVLKGCADVEESVRSAACLTAGLYVTLDWFVKDGDFILQVARLMPTLTRDKALLVRVRASWAVANLGDTLLLTLFPMNNGARLAVMVAGEEGVYRELVQSAVFSANDNEKCRSNGVRAIGNFLRVAPGSCFSPGLVNEMEAIHKNIKSGAFKVRWNACYSAYNLFLSPHLPPTSPHLPPLLNTLTAALTTSKNFKVRINAAIALSGPPRAELYAGKLDVVLEACMRARGDVDDLRGIGFGEVRYQEGLVEQLGRTVGHLEGLKGV
ncbi:hypothetical protein HDU98_003726 [Podochytrium sp. JEL0797]|nr:hypothetical protein HDU98_003726 [Podochytrium sp. JEL0797]